MVSNKSSSARRREVRRNIPRRQETWTAAIFRKEVGWAALFVALFAIGATLLEVSGRQQPRYALNQVVSQAVVARVQFESIDQAETAKRKQQAFDREPAVYVPNSDYLSKLRAELMGLLKLPEQATKAVGVSPEALTELKKFNTTPPPQPDWKTLVDRFMEGFTGLAILAPARAELEKDTSQSPSRIYIMHPTIGRQERYRPVIYNVAKDQVTIRENVLSLVRPPHFPAALRDLVLHTVMAKLEPTYLFDRDTTRQDREAARKNEPPVLMTYQPNDVLVNAGQKLTDRDMQVLAAEQKAYAASLSTFERWSSYGALLGLMALVGLGLWVYLLAYYPRVGENPMRGMTMTLLLLGCLGLAVLGVATFGPRYVAVPTVFPTLLAVTVLAIAYDQRLALAVGAVLALLVTLALKLPAAYVLVLLVGVIVAAQQLHDVRSRSKLMWTGLWTGLALGVALCLYGLATRRIDLPEQLRDILDDAMLAVGAGLVVSLFVEGALPTIERVCRVSTSMTLKELNDASHPLLRRLAQEAPGTYQHSLRIADMAEAAADAIGANGLLCKVGAMYHDIGKINKPQYFVENQGGGPNRHNKLSPAMSHLIIVGHVKDGVEMAREYGLPPGIRHFIESHHGTTLVEYFYHAARKKSEETATTAPTEFEFRYPGPKPQTREAAILMLCDGVEGAARTLDEPTPIRLEQLVHNMAMKRLMDGQFDECNLTLQELSRIEAAITKTLCAIYHSRIKYPSAESDDEARPGAGSGTAPAETVAAG